MAALITPEKAQEFIANREHIIKELASRLSVASEFEFVEFVHLLDLAADLKIGAAKNVGCYL